MKHQWKAGDLALLKTSGNLFRLHRSPDGWRDGGYVWTSAGTPVVLLEYDPDYHGFLIGLLGDIYVRVYPTDLVPSDAVQ